MTRYVKAFFIAGVVIPVLLHLLASEGTPWWPDTVSLGIGFGVAAVVIVSRAEADREMRRRLWRALQNLVRHRNSR